MTATPLANDIGPEIDAIIGDIAPRLIEIRRDLHAHPEVGFETIRTAAIVADELRAMGLEPQTGIGRTGVMVDIQGGRPGPCILLRADMDALPIHEQTGLPFASTIAGKMHACGHDIHTSALLGTAKALKDIAPRLAGTARLIFQPAEEIQDSGAVAMIQDGAAKGISAAITFHNRPELEAGRIMLNRGASTASCDEFTVTVRGKSGHAARPHGAVDPIVAAAFMVTQLQTVISREMDPSLSAVLTIGHFQGGATHNIIPDTCIFEGTCRCRSPQSRDKVEAAFRRICEGVAMAQGVTVEIDYQRGAPALLNDDRLVERANEALRAQFAEPPIIVEGSSFGGEDFSYFTELAPGLQLQIGSAQAGRADRLHNSDYQPDESCIAQSAIAMARVAVDLLS